MADKPKSGPAAARQPGLAVWSRIFLAELANTSNVSAAARKAGVCVSRVYDARRSNPDFYRKWQVALCEGYDNLEMDLLHRLRSGEIKPPTGAKRGARNFDNATAFRLLSVHRESAARERALRDNEDADAVLASIDAKLDRMRARAQAVAETPPAETPAADHDAHVPQK